MARLIVVALLVLWPSLAMASGGRVELSRGPVELRAVNGVFEGAFDIRNPSDEPLTVSRIAPRTDTDDVRLPRRVTARLESGQLGGVIPPHGTGRVRISWPPDRGAPPRSFYGHVVVTSSDESAGEVAMGFAVHATPYGALGRHLLSVIIACPLLAAALLAFGLSGASTGRLPRVVALVATTASALVALLAWRAFDPTWTHADGGDGLQHVERAVLARAMGVELFLGVDGASLPLVVLCALVAPCGVLVSWDERRSPAVFFSGYLLLVGASLGALTALDAALFFACLSLALTATFMTVGLYARDGAASARVMLVGGLGLVLVAVALGTLHGASTHAFLVDGTRTTHTWALPELARVSFEPSLARRVAVLGLLGLGLLAGLFPLHSWLAPVLRSAPAGVAAMVCVGVTRAALLGCLRLMALVLPDTLRWAAPTLTALGAAGALYTALVSVAEQDLADVAVLGLASASGSVLVGVGALTPEALLGAVTVTTVSGLATAVLLLALGVVRARTGTLVIRELRGLGLEAPLLAGLLVLGAAAVAGLPGTAGFWGTWLVALGALVREPVAAGAVLVAAVLLAAGQVVPALRVTRGRLPPAMRRSEALLPFGGRVPEVRARELAAMVPLVVVLVLLGFYPSPLVGRAASTCKDVNELVNPPGPAHVE